MAAGYSHGELCEGTVASSGGAGGWLHRIYVNAGPGQRGPHAVFRGARSGGGIAAMNTITMFSGFLGPYWMGVMKDRTGSYAAGLRGLVLPCLLAAVTMYALTRSLARQNLKASAAALADEPA